jgi:hypothetical protein
VKDPERVKVLYAAACDLVHGIMGQGGGPAFGELLDRLGRRESLDAALRAVYGLSLAELVDGWRAGLPR